MWFARLAESIQSQPSLLLQQWTLPKTVDGKLKWYSPAAQTDVELLISQELRKRKTLWVSAVTELSGAHPSAHGFGTRMFAKPALTVSIAEAWERYQLNWITNADPSTVQGLPWSVVKDLGRGQDASVRFEETPWQECHSSNGFAAGRTLLEAAVSAAAELFERHCVLSVWNHESRFARLQFNEPFWLAPAKLNGWSFRWYELGRCNDFVTVACLARHPKLGARFDASAKPTPLRAAQEAAVSVLRMIYEVTPQDLNLDDLWAKGEPLAHMAYYMDPAHLPAFEFLDYSSSQRSTTFGQFDPAIVPLWVSDHMPAVARTLWTTAKQPRWGDDALKLTPNNQCPHPLA